MSKTAVSKPKPRSKPKTPDKRQRFTRATRKERQAKLEPPPLAPDQKVMSQLLPGEKLKALARSRSAGDIPYTRQRQDEQHAKHADEYPLPL